MLKQCDTSVLDVDNFDFFGSNLLSHVGCLRSADRLECGVPTRPVRLISELARRLPDALLKGTRKRFRRISAVERDLGDRVLRPRQSVGRTLEARELDKFVDADAA